MVRASSYRKADTLIEMDTVIQSINDEENGIFENWIMWHVPDRATREELIQYIEEDDTFYPEACEFFARYISNLICHGEWNVDGYTTEFFNSKYYEKPKELICES